MAHRERERQRQDMAGGLPGGHGRVGGCYGRSQSQANTVRCVKVVFASPSSRSRGLLLVEDEQFVVVSDPRRIILAT